MMRKIVGIFVVIPFLLMVATKSSSGAAGDLDFSFNGTGKVITDFPLTYGADGSATTLQSDGKIIVAGVVRDAEDYDFGLVRYTVDGSVDTTFGVNGRVSTDFLGGSDDLANAIVLQEDGKIIVAGEADLRFALARYQSNGNLDSAFGIGGLVTGPFNFQSSIFSIVVQSDGKIIAAGYHVINSSAMFALVRYNPDGSPDDSFGSEGQVTLIGGVARAIALQSDGKIVVSGAGGDFYTARCNSDGSLDSSFGNNGLVITDLSGPSEFAVSNVIQPDGKIVVAGMSWVVDSWDFALVRYGSDGSLDMNFGNGGIVITDIGSDDWLYRAVLQQDGKIVAVGNTTYNDLDFAIARYDSDGSLDSSFGIDGKVTTDFAPPDNEFAADDSGFDAVIQSDGKIVVAGSVFIYDSQYSGTTYFGVARYMGDPPSCDLFCEDFQNGLPSNWTYVKPNWTESSGILIGTPASRKAETVAIPAFDGCSQCSVQASLSTAGGPLNKVWLLTWFQNKGNTVEVLMKEENDRWVLKQRSGGRVVAKVKGLAPIMPNVFYDVKVLFDGMKFTLIVNGSTLAVLQAAATPQGTVGFRVKNTTGKFDFIAVN